MICHKCDNNSVDLCVKYLSAGKVLILPTDTVYGFSGIVSNEQNTDSRIKQIKGRDEGKPFIQLIAKPEDIYRYTNDNIPPFLLSYWPGPLTIIVNNKNSDEKLKTIAFRCPGDSWLRDILSKLEYPIYSTSVNKSGFPVLDNEQDIVNQFSNKTDLIVLDGDKKNALPSTIVTVTDGELKIIRKGAVDIKF